METIEGNELPLAIWKKSNEQIEFENKVLAIEMKTKQTEEKGTGKKEQIQKKYCWFWRRKWGQWRNLQILSTYYNNFFTIINTTILS